MTNNNTPSWMVQEYPIGARFTLKAGYGYFEHSRGFPDFTRATSDMEVVVYAHSGSEIYFKTLTGCTISTRHNQNYLARMEA